MYILVYSADGSAVAHRGGQAYPLDAVSGTAGWAGRRRILHD